MPKEEELRTRKVHKPMMTEAEADEKRARVITYIAQLLASPLLNDNAVYFIAGLVATVIQPIARMGDSPWGVERLMSLEDAAAQAALLPPDHEYIGRVKL